MAEETTRVPPASLVSKSRGGDKRRSFEAERSSTSSGKGVPHYLRPSTGSCHDYCKHGRKEEHDSEAKESRPWRKPAKESGIAAVVKKNVVVKPRLSADLLAKSPARDTTEQEISTACDNVDVHIEQASTGASQIVIVESKTSDGPDTPPSREETVKQEISVASENVAVSEDASSDANGLSKKSSTVSKVKQSLRPPSPISSGPSVGRNMGGRKSLDVEKAFEGRTGVDKMKIIEGRKSVEGGSSFGWRNSIDVRKSVERRSPFEGRKSSDVRKSIEARKTLNGNSSPDESKSVDPQTTKKCEVENNSVGGESTDEMKSIEGSESSLEKKGSEESRSLNLETNEKDDSLGNAKNDGKSELLKKHVAAPKPKISTKKPPSPLHPLAAKPASLKSLALKPPSPLHPLSGTRSRTSEISPSLKPLAVKPPSPIHPSSSTRSRTSEDSPSVKPLSVKPRSPIHPSSSTRSRTSEDSSSPIPLAVKSPSPLHPSSGMRSRTSDGVAEKSSTSELDAKKEGTATSVSPSSKPDREENKVTRKVRDVRVVSSVRRQSKITRVAAEDPDDQGAQEDTVDASKIPLEKKSLSGSKLKAASSNSSLPPAPSVSKPTIRSKISYIPSRLRKPPGESEPKGTTKDASTYGFRKGKAVDLDSENREQITLKARNRTTSLAETSQITRRISLKKRVSPVEAVKKNSSDRLLLRRPSIGRKKNVQVLFNNVIEETAKRLVRTRKSKVLALVGAFETVISIQKKSSAGTKPKPKRPTSSS
uniref:Calmodulin-binding domain-containing protein n=1 Tax=Kalanchoe fedtschenkoi TaxID=63787 RepID=A0A7N0UZV9_KALFE